MVTYSIAPVNIRLLITTLIWKLMESCNGFIETATGAIQIHPYFNALSDELAMAKLIVESSSTSK